MKIENNKLTSCALNLRLAAVSGVPIADAEAYCRIFVSVFWGIE